MGYDKVIFPPNTTFLVTGGAGFIGSNLCEALLNSGYRVRCLDNLSTGKLANIEAFFDNNRFEFIKGDICDFDTCLSATRGIDYVMHEAAWGSVPRSIAMPLFYETNNIKGTLNMLEAARQNGVKQFVYASSSSVYGDSPVLPKSEERVGQVLSPYALTKKVNELYGSLYYRLYGLKTVGLRYFNVFGRRQDPNGMYAAVIPKFIKSALTNERPTINGDGSYSRDFTYIDNVIEANLKACLAGEKACGQVFNIAFGGQVTIRNLCRTIYESCGSNLEPIFGPVRQGDIPHSNADISKARNLLGYDPSFSFEDGIKLSLEWYKKHL